MKSSMTSHKAVVAASSHATEQCSDASGSLTYLETCIEAVQFLNVLTGSKFSPFARATLACIEKLISKGYQLSEIKEVIGYKVNKWMCVPNMRPYLRPSTLFDIANFKRYHAEVLQSKNSQQ